MDRSPSEDISDQLTDRGNEENNNGLESNDNDREKTAQENSLPDSRSRVRGRKPLKKETNERYVLENGMQKYQLTGLSSPKYYLYTNLC